MGQGGGLEGGVGGGVGGFGGVRRVMMVLVWFVLLKFLLYVSGILQIVALVVIL